MSVTNTRTRARVAAALSSVVALSGLGVALSAQPAAADTCPNSRDVFVPGGESHYTISCSGGRVYVNGRVKDTRADGKCAEVKAQFGSTFYFSGRACPAGTTRYFNWSGPGSIAYVWTYTS